MNWKSKSFKRNHIVKETASQSFKTHMTIWVLKLFLNFQICISREWAEKAGRFSDAHSSTFTKDNEHGKPTSKGQVRGSQRTMDQVLSFQKNRISIWLKTNKKKCSTTRAENLCNFCSAGFHHWYELVTVMYPIFFLSN